MARRPEVPSRPMSIDELSAYNDRSHYSPKTMSNGSTVRCSQSACAGTWHHPSRCSVWLQSGKFFGGGADRRDNPPMAITTLEDLQEQMVRDIEDDFKDWGFEYV